MISASTNIFMKREEILDKGSSTTDSIAHGQKKQSYFDLKLIPSSSSKKDGIELDASSSSLSSHCSDDCDLCQCDDFDNEPINDRSLEGGEINILTQKNEVSFQTFRLQYLVTFTAIMLADGLQGKRDVLFFAHHISL